MDSMLHIEPSLLEEMLERMMLIRAFEERVSLRKTENKLRGMVHSYAGQEAVAVGTCFALRQDDYIVSNHRPHGHAIAKGVDVKQIMSEMYGKVTGTNHGKGGSMHLNDPKNGLYSASGIVGSGIPVACGIAFASQYRGDDNITACFIGDGATAEGVMHESLNISSKWKLPVIFIIEDNGLAITTAKDRTIAIRDYVKWANAYGVEAYSVDGQNVEQVYLTVSSAAKKIRQGFGPVLIRCETIRFREHAEGEYYLRMKERKYRDYELLSRQISEKCPIELTKKVLLCNNLIDQNRIKQIEQKTETLIDEAEAYAISSELPKETDAVRGVFN